MSTGRLSSKFEQLCEVSTKASSKLRDKDGLLTFESFLRSMYQEEDKTKEEEEEEGEEEVSNDDDEYAFLYDSDGDTTNTPITPKRVLSFGEKKTNTKNTNTSKTQNNNKNNKQSSFEPTYDEDDNNFVSLLDNMAESKEDLYYAKPPGLNESPKRRSLRLTDDTSKKPNFEDSNPIGKKGNNKTTKEEKGKKKGKDQEKEDMEVDSPVSTPIPVLVQPKEKSKRGKKRLSFGTNTEFEYSTNNFDPEQIIYDVEKEEEEEISNTTKTSKTTKGSRKNDENSPTQKEVRATRSSNKNVEVETIVIEDNNKKGKGGKKTQQQPVEKEKKQTTPEKPTQKGKNNNKNENKSVTEKLQNFESTGELPIFDEPILSNRSSGKKKRSQDLDLSEETENPTKRRKPVNSYQTKKQRRQSVLLSPRPSQVYYSLDDKEQADISPKALRGQLLNRREKRKLQPPVRFWTGERVEYEHTHTPVKVVYMTNPTHTTPHKFPKL